MPSYSVLDLVLAFLITWTIVLIPPTIIRFARKKPLTKPISIALCFGFYFVNLAIFFALGSESKSHTALAIGTFLSYRVLRWETNANAGKSVEEQRRAAGYDN